MNKNIQFVQARMAVGLALPEASGKTPPAEIQWMPPGKHRINATVAGKPGALDVNVTAAVAAKLAEQLQDIRSRAAAQREDAPFFDFNHDDAEASAYPTEIYWGGDDPKTGGIRAKLEWSDAGASAVVGKAYRRFSPNFGVTKTGEIQLSGVNLGGLVNRAAFKEIAPIMSRGSGGEHEGKKENSMEIEELKKVVDAQAAAIETLKTELKTVQAKAAKVDDLTTKIAGIEEGIKVQAKASAVEIVNRAASAGKIPPQDQAGKDRWVEMIMVNAKSAELLMGLPDNPALVKITGNNNGKPGGNGTAAAGEADFMVKAKALAAERKISQDEAITVLAKEQPDAYETFRKGIAPKAE